MNAMTFTEVVRAEYAGGYRVRLWFNDETVKTVDLEQSLKGSAFEPLKDVERFKRFEVKYATIGWENGADLAPEYLFELPAVEGIKQQPPITPGKEGGTKKAGYMSGETLSCTRPFPLAATAIAAVFRVSSLAFQ